MERGERESRSQLQPQALASRRRPRLPWLARAVLVIAACSLCRLSSAASPSPSPSRSPLPRALPAHCVNESHFFCHSADLPCIPLEWRCDNIPDCPNGQDEEKCAYFHDCSHGDLTCRNGECISANFKCDGQVDCSDGTDERGCNEMEQLKRLHSAARESSSARPTSSPSGSALSTLSKSSSFVESPFRSSSHACSRGQFACGEGTKCIPEDAKCDGTEDCPYGEDEKDCDDAFKSVANAAISMILPFSPASDRVCKAGHVKCGDGSACIPVSWVCDGQEDCEDDSDESECSELEAEADAEAAASRSQSEATSRLPDLNEFLQTSVHNLCKAGEFHCHGGACIPATRACDGHVDCAGGEDEAGRCGDCKKTFCQHDCRDTPTGPHCTCPAGMKLAHDLTSCEDIDECLQDGKHCSQYCENTGSGYMCTCSAGYILAADKHTCHLEAGGDEEGTILISLGAEVRSMPLFAPQLSRNSYSTWVSLSSIGTCRSIANYAEENRIFLAMQNGPLSVWEAGHLYSLRENLPGLNYVAVDWVGGNIIFTARAPNPNPGIYMCTSSGLFCRIIVPGKSESSLNPGQKQNYRGLAVHPLRGLLAWIDVFGSHHRIMISNLDGTKVRTLVDHKLDYPTGLAFDFIKNELYFGDMERELIEKINIDSQDRSVVLSSGVHHPYDMAFFNGFIYWTDWSTETLKVASLGRSHSSPHLIHSFNVFPYGLAINHTLIQPNLSQSNPCDHLPCPWMCVVVEGNPSVLSSSMDSLLEARCLCPEGYERNPSFNITVEGSLPCRVEGGLQQSIRDDSMSTIGISLMKEYCSTGRACSNGGGCVEHQNEHGRVDRITCSCSPGFSGDACEIEASRMEFKDGSRGNSDFNWTPFFVCLFIVLAAAGLIYCAKNHSSTFGSLESAARSVRLPSPVAALHTRISSASSPFSKFRRPRQQEQHPSVRGVDSATGGTSSSGQSPPRRGVLFSSPLSSRISQSSSTPSFTTGLANANFVNPLYDHPPTFQEPQDILAPQEVDDTRVSLLMENGGGPL